MNLLAKHPVGHRCVLITWARQLQGKQFQPLLNSCISLSAVELLLLERFKLDAEVITREMTEIGLEKK